MLIKKKRILRRNTRKIDSPYRVHCNNVTANDVLELSIFDEKNKSVPIHIFNFSGARISQYNSIHFNAIELNGSWQIDFTEVNPD